MRIGLIAKKLGMTRHFREDGSNVPVTLLGIEKNYVTRVRENSVRNSKHIQIAAGNVKVKKLKKPLRNYFSKLKIEPKKKFWNLVYQMIKMQMLATRLIQVFLK